MNELFLIRSLQVISDSVPGAQDILKTEHTVVTTSKPTWISLSIIAIDLWCTATAVVPENSARSLLNFLEPRRRCLNICASSSISVELPRYRCSIFCSSSNLIHVSESIEARHQLCSRFAPSSFFRYSWPAHIFALHSHYPMSSDRFLGYLLIHEELFTRTKLTISVVLFIPCIQPRYWRFLAWWSCMSVIIMTRTS